MNRSSCLALLAAAVVVVAAAMAVAGCASTRINDELIADRTPGAPSMIYVENFDLGAATVKADPHTLSGRPRLIQLHQTDPATKLEKLSDLLAESLVQDLHKKHLPAQRLFAEAGAPRPTSGWLVSGGFLEVVEGNRLQKAVVGLGAGDSHADLYVAAADLAAPPGKQDLLDFDVNSQGDKAPGGGAVVEIAAHTPYGMAAKYVLDRNASEQDIKRAAQRIADGLEKLAQGRQPT